MLSTIEKVLHLKSVSIFSQIPDSALASIAPLLEEVAFLPNQPIFKKTDLGDALYVVVSGTVKIEDDGFELEQLGEGGVFGELALLDGAPRSASATAADDTLLLRLPQAAFHELLDDYGEIARGILYVLSQRLRTRTEDLNELRSAAE